MGRAHPNFQFSLRRRAIGRHHRARMTRRVCQVLYVLGLAGLVAGFFAKDGAILVSGALLGVIATCIYVMDR